MFALQWRRSVAISIYCWAWLSSIVEARPFVLLSGWDSLPDDDLDAPKPFYASVGQANVRADDGGPVYVVNSAQQPRPEDVVYRLNHQGAPLRNSWGLPVVPPSMPAQLPRALQRLKELAAANAAANARPTLDRFGSGVPGREPFQLAHVTSDVGDVAALSAAPIQRLSQPEPAPRCHDAREDIVIESGLQGNADVFSNGRATRAWATSSRSPYVLPSAEQVAVFVVRTGKAAFLSRPEIVVSDPSVLTVQLAEKKRGGTGMMPGADGDAVVFLSKHICKKAGIAKVTIKLPLRKVTSASSCPGLPAPAVFSYQKECHPTTHTLGTFNEALSAKLPEHDKVIAFRSKAKEMPWHGIIPSGGGRAILGVFLAMALAVMAYEFGTIWLSNQIKKAILDMGPVMLGCQASCDHVALSFWFGHMTYTMQGLRFENPEGVVCKNEYFMKIDEVKLWFNLHKLIVTCGKQIEIRNLTARHIQCNVEVDGYVYGESNISKVIVQMEKNNKKWLADLAAIKENHGIDASALWDSFEGWMKKTAERVTLQEVFMEGISSHASTKALGMEVSIADMAFHDFSHQHDAVGMTAIAYFLIHAVLEGMCEDIAGVEMGHGRFEGLVNSLKAWTGAGAAPPPAALPDGPP